MIDRNDPRYVDRTGFPPGPWDNEPDKTQWTTKAGLPGLLVRNRIGSLCAYAAVTPGHPPHGTDYDKAQATYEITAHGGLTYSNTCQADGPICHTPEPGQPDDVWWFGFDCAHGNDASPGLEYVMGYFSFTRTYRDIHYVTEEVENLAQQLADLN